MQANQSGLTLFGDRFLRVSGQRSMGQRETAFGQKRTCSDSAKKHGLFLETPPAKDRANIAQDIRATHV